MRRLHLKQQIAIEDTNCGISQFFHESQGKKSQGQNARMLTEM